jgi:iron complex outermembrane recepter protein
MKQLCIAAAALSIVTPVLAQAAEATAAGASEGLQEVVVTAQRREESLQDVPISITAFTATELQQSDINYAKDYLQLTPNVSYAQDGQTGNNSIRISIRGVSNISLGERAVPNSIGYYVDEFNVGTVAQGTINPNLLDVDRVEVLRGPQGTYFGRNAAGGALNITTNAPDKDWFAEVAAYAGNWEVQGGHVIINAPVSDTFFLRGAIGFESSTGTVKNVNPTGNPNSGYDNTNARLAAKWLITDKFTADASYTYGHDREGLDASVNTGVLELDTISIEGANFRPIDDGLGFYPQNTEYVNHGRYEWNHNDLHEGNLRLTYDFGDFTLKSISGDIKTDNSRMFDEDAVSVDAIYRHNEWSSESYSEELRLQSKPGGLFDWVVGAIYAKDIVRQWNLVAIGTEFTYTYPDTGETVGVVPPYPNLPVNENLTQYSDKSTAAYVDVTWHYTPQWAFTLGGRYTHDDIDDSVTGLVAFGTPQGNLYGNSNYNDFSPRAVTTYKWTDNQMTYATISHGYKSGGNDLNAELPQQNKPFEPEKVWNFEVGYKSEFWDHKGLLNAAVFFADWQNLQSEVNYLAVPGDISSAVEVTENASSAKNQGVELETKIRPIPQLTLGASAGYLDAHFGYFGDAVIYGVPVNLSDRPLPQAPKWTGNTTAQWSQNFGRDGSWYFLWEEAFRSRSYSNLEGVAAEQLGLGTFPFLMPSWVITNLHTGITMGKLSLEGSVDNLFGKKYYTGTGDHFGFGGVRVTPNPMKFQIEMIYRMK